MKGGIYDAITGLRIDAPESSDQGGTSDKQASRSSSLPSNIVKLHYLHVTYLAHVALSSWYFLVLSEDVIERRCACKCIVCIHSSTKLQLRCSRTALICYRGARAAYMKS